MFFRAIPPDIPQYILGVHTISPRPETPHIEKLLEGFPLIINYTEVYSKEKREIGVVEYQKALLKKECFWNILDFISQRDEKVNSMKLCPLLPAIIKSAKGSEMWANMRIEEIETNMYCEAKQELITNDYIVGDPNEIIKEMVKLLNPEIKKKSNEEKIKQVTQKYGEGSRKCASIVLDKLNEVHQIKTWNKSKVPYVTENRVLALMEAAFNKCGERGTILHGYSTDFYLGMLIESITTEDTYDPNGDEIPDTWRKLAAMKGLPNIDDIEINEDKGGLKGFRDILDKFSDCTGDEEKILEEVKKKFDEATRKCASIILKKLKKVYRDPGNSDTTWELKSNDDSLPIILKGPQIKCYIEKVYRLAYISLKGKEVDLFVILPDYRYVLQIEIKDRDGLQICMNSAKPQFSSMLEWTNTIHGGILDGWNYAAIGCFTKVPKSDFNESYKEHFYISKDCYEDIENGITKWWERFKESVIKEKAKQLISSDTSYMEFMKRCVGFAKLTEDLRQNKSKLLEKHHEYIHGDSANPISSGFEEVDSLPENCISYNQNLNKMDDTGCKQTLPLLMWTNEQSALLQMKSSNSVLLKSNFGSGEK